MVHGQEKFLHVQVSILVIKVKVNTLYNSFSTGAKCPVFPEIKNGYFVDSTREYFFNDEVRVQCHKGYKLIGNGALRCGENQQFNNPPRCEDINECIASQCDASSTECINNPGSFYCKCKKGFVSRTDCRPLELGLINGGIPDEAISVSSTEPGYNKNVSKIEFTSYMRYLKFHNCRIFV